MNAEKTDDIIEILKQCESERLNYIDAKKRVLAAGYSENELIHAVYLFPYDGIPNEKNMQSEMERYYNARPEVAKQHAEVLASHARQEHFVRTINGTDLRSRGVRFVGRRWGRIASYSLYLAILFILIANFQDSLSLNPIVAYWVTILLMLLPSLIGVFLYFRRRRNIKNYPHNRLQLIGIAVVAYVALTFAISFASFMLSLALASLFGT